MTVETTPLGNDHAPRGGRAWAGGELQPGLLDVLRLFAAFHVVKGAVLTLHAFSAQPQNVLINLLPFATALALLAFLLSGMPRERLGRRYIDAAVLFPRWTP